jgi:hypothetical protein
MLNDNVQQNLDAFADWAKEADPAYVHQVILAYAKKDHHHARPSGHHRLALTSSKYGMDLSGLIWYKLSK